MISHEEGLSHCWINQNSKILLGYFEEGQQFSYSYNKTNKALFAFVITGKAACNDLTVMERDAIGIWDTAEVTFEARTLTEIVLIEVVINQK